MQCSTREVLRMGGAQLGIGRLARLRVSGAAHAHVMGRVVACEEEGDPLHADRRYSA